MFIAFFNDIMEFVRREATKYLIWFLYMVEFLSGMQYEYIEKLLKPLESYSELR